MPTQKDEAQEIDVVMGVDPLSDDDEVLARTLYGNPVSPPRGVTPARPIATPVAERPNVAAPAPLVAAPAAPKTKTAGTSRRKKQKDPQHYKVLSISLYNEDIDKMDELVKELKKRGFTRANRSALIRFALDQVDITKMPKGY